VHHSGSKVLDQHVGLCRKLTRGVASIGGPEVEHDALLVAIHLEVEVVHDELGDVCARVRLAPRVRPLDPDHPRPEVGEYSGRAWTGPEGREVKHEDSS
jgi:hypothetical protein